MLLSLSDGLVLLIVGLKKGASTEDGHFKLSQKLSGIFMGQLGHQEAIWNVYKTKN